MELSSKWDTLDKNSRRYIATVMAGNRQQSRFLALVGNYDLLMESMSIAENSEDEGMLQMLKTMDSLETKIAQFQNSIKLFYTSSGLEELIKGLVDFGTNVVNFMNNLPKLGKIPITALMNIINVISLLKNAVLGMLVEIKNNFDQQMELAKQQAAKDGMQAGRSFKDNFNRAVKGLKAGIGVNEEKTKEQNISSWVQAGGTALSMIGTVVGGSNQRLGEGISGAGMSITGAAQLFSGNIIGGTMSLVSGLVQLWDALDYSIEEQIADLQEQYEELNNTAIQKKSDYKNLKSAIEKYDQLADAQYDSAEAAQEFKDYQKELVEQYPELIKAYDQNNNAILDAEKMEEALQKARQASADATRDATVKELELRKKEREQKYQQLKDNNMDYVFTSRQAGIGGTAENDEGDDLYSFNIDFNSGKVFLDGEEKSLNNFGQTAFNSLKEKYSSLLQRADSGKRDEQYWEDFLVFYNDADNFLKNYIFSEGESGSALSGFSGKFDTSFLGYLGEINDSKEAEQLVANREIYSSLNSKLNETYLNGADPIVEYFDEATGLYNFFALAIKKKYDEAGEAYDSMDAFLDSAEGEQSISDYFNEFLDWYEGLSQANQELFNQMVAAPEKYSSGDIISSFGVEEGSDLWDSIISYYEDTQKEIQDRITEKVKNSNSNIGLKITDNYIQQFNTEDKANLLTSVIEQAQTYYDKGFEQLGNDYLDGFLSVWNSIQNSDFSATERATLIEALNQADLSSITGIQEFASSLEDMEFLDDGQKDALLGTLDSLGHAILINFTTGIGGLQDTITTKVKTLTDNISKFGDSMSFEDAMEAFQTLQASGAIVNEAFSDVFKVDPEDATKYILSSGTSLDNYISKTTDILKEQRDNLQDAYEKSSGMFKNQLVVWGDRRQYENLGENETVLGKAIDFGTITEKEGKIISSYGLENEFETYVLEPTQDNWEAFYAAYLEACQAAGGQIESLDEFINNLPKRTEAEVALANKQFVKAAVLAEGDSSLQQRITNGARDAYSELFSTFFEEGTEGLKRVMPTYAGTDLEKMANDLISGAWSGESLLELFSLYFSPEEFNELYAQMLEALTKSTVGDAKEALSKLDFVSENKGYGSLSDITSLATALDVKVSDIIRDYNAEIGAYSFELDDDLAARMKELGYTIYDSITEVFKDINDLIKSTDMSGEEKSKLSGLLKTYGIDIGDADFTQTAEGFQLVQSSAYRIAGSLREINSLAAQTTIENLASSAKESDERLNDVFYVMKRIDEINKELENPEIKDARRKELEGELAVAQELNRELQKADDTFNFMKGSTPSGWDDPLSAWEGLGSAFEVIDGDDFSNGYMSVDNFRNMISFAGDEILATCGTAGEQFKTAEDLLNAGLTALTTVDGNVVVDLSKLGADFSLGADGMKEGIADAVKTLAKNQIEILDAEINMLQTVVDTQKAFDSISGKDNVIQISELTPEIDTSTGERKWTKDQQKVMDFFSKYAGDLELTLENGGKTTIADLAKNPEKWFNLSDESRTLMAALANQMMSMLTTTDWSTITGENSTVIQNALNEILTQYGQSITIDPSKLLETVNIERGENTEENPLIQKIAEAFGGEITPKKVIDAITASGKTELTVGEIVDLVAGDDEDLKEQAAQVIQSLITTFSDSNVKWDTTLQTYVSSDGTIIDEDGNKVSVTEYKEEQLRKLNEELSGEGETPLTIHPTVTASGVKYKVDGVEGEYNSYDEALDAALQSQKKSETETTATESDIEIIPQKIYVKQGEGVNEDGSLQLSDPISKATAQVDELEIVPTKTTITDENGLQIENQEIQLTLTPAAMQTVATLASLDLNALSASLAEMLANGEELVDLQFDNFANLETATQTAEQTVNNIAQKLSEMTGKTITINVVEQSNGEDGNGNSTYTTTYTFNTENLTTAVSQVQTATNNTAQAISKVAQAMDKVPKDSKIPQNINKTADSINNLPRNKTVKVSVSLPSKTVLNAEATLTVKVQGAAGTVVSGITNKKISSPISGKVDMTQAKGNVALAKGTKTLMGELGPELVVSDGKYFLAGENGAEFVNLADDAIVFNHLQTQRLLANGSTGRGTAVTNEKKAVAFAKGNAMASASDALNELKRIRAMWQALLDASASDLGKKAGSGGGGGGGGGNGDDPKAITHDLERWYNLLRQIAKCEQQITLEQSKRENLQSGYKYVDSLENELEILRKQEKAYRQLASIQKDWYDIRRKELLNTDFAKIFTYDEDGLMQYVDGTDRGLDILAKLNSTDATGAPTGVGANSQAQINYLKSIGFDVEKYLRTNDDGTKAESTDDMMQNFWDRVDGWMDELDGLYDEYNDHLNDIEENISNQNEILQEYIDNQLSVEEKMLTAITDARQAEIDKMQDILDATQDATDKYISGLSDALSKEQNLYNDNQSQQELSKLQRQLAILQRSGGSASEIKNLQNQIDSKLQSDYFDAMQKQIDAIQEASDNQIEKLQEQIDIATEALEYQKENGLLWEQVYQMMNEWTPEKMLEFIEKYTASYKENSGLQNQEDSKETKKELEIWAAKRDLAERDSAWEAYFSNAKYEQSIKEANKAEAQNAFNEAFASGGKEAGAKAADEIFEKATKKPSTPSSGGDGSSTGGNSGSSGSQETYSTGKGKVSTKKDRLNVRSSPSTSAKVIGKLSKGASATLTGYNGKWYRIDYNGKTGYVYGSYISTSDKDKLPRFASGGLVDFTGPAWLDGTKQKPEAVLSAEDTALLRNQVFGKGDNSLIACIQAIQELASNSTVVSEGNSGVNIENISIDIAPGTISSDYSARKAGQEIMDEILNIAKKSGNLTLARR